jgi:hypothetical protein
MILRFPFAAVLELVEHSEAAPSQNPDFAHLCDPEFWKPDAKPDHFGYVSAVDVDTSKIKPGLLVVKDQGIYVMSPGNPGLLVSQEPVRHKVVYAEGFAPDCDHEAMCDAVGGDDFSERLDCASIRHQAKRVNKPAWLCVQFDDDVFAMWVEAAGGRRR